MGWTSTEVLANTASYVIGQPQGWFGIDREEPTVQSSIVIINIPVAESLVDSVNRMKPVATLKSPDRIEDYLPMVGMLCPCYDVEMSL